jgi:hypothetical protein
MTSMSLICAVAAAAVGRCFHSFLATSSSYRVFVLCRTKHSELSTGIQLDLLPGQCLYWNGDLIHRGDTKAHIERRTLISSWEAWDPAQTVRAVRARGGVLKQRMDTVWRCQPEVREAMPSDRRRLMYDRWLATQPYALEHGLLPG